MTYMWALYAREVKRFQKIWLDTVLSPIVSILLYFFVFSIVVGERNVVGMSYQVFIYTGLLAMNLINNSFSNPVFALIMSKNLGTLSDLQVVPLKPWQVGFAYAVAALTRSVITLVIAVLLTIWFVPGMMLAHPLLLVAAVALSGLLMGAAGVVVGSIGKNFETLTFVMSFVLQPLIFFSGVFYPVAGLPEGWRMIATVNPLHHVMNILRYSITDYADVSPAISFAIVGGMAIVLFILMQYTTRRMLKAD